MAFRKRMMWKSNAGRWATESQRRAERCRELRKHSIRQEKVERIYVAKKNCLLLCPVHLSIEWYRPSDHKTVYDILSFLMHMLFTYCIFIHRVLLIIAVWCPQANRKKSHPVEVFLQAEQIGNLPTTECWNHRESKRRWWNVKSVFFGFLPWFVFLNLFALWCIDQVSPFLGTSRYFLRRPATRTEFIIADLLRLKRFDSASLQECDSAKAWLKFAVNGR